MAKRVVLLVALLMAMRLVSVPTFGQQFSIPHEVYGVEITGVRGWHANRYFWPNIPELATVWPIFREPGQFPSAFEVAHDTQLLVQYGSGADVITFNPNTDSPDYNQLLRNGYLADCGLDDKYGHNGRPFYLLYEHVNGTRFVHTREDRRIDMSLTVNRQRFEEDLKFMLESIIVPCQARYVTWNRRALIFLWSMGDMIYAAPLLEEMRIKYPVAFVGGVNVLHFPSLQGPEDMKSLQALDVIMEYTLYPVVPTPVEATAGRIDYARMVRMHSAGNLHLSFAINEFEKVTGRKYLLIPTMPFAFDDTKWPGRTNLPMYALNKREVEDFAKRLYDGMRNGIYSLLIGPFTIWDEYFEGGAVAPSQCTSATLDRPGRFVGCGYTRLAIMEQFFSKGKK